MIMIGLGAIFAYVVALPFVFAYLGWRKLGQNTGMAAALIAAAVLFVGQGLLFGPLQMTDRLGVDSARMVMLIIGAFGLVALLWRMFEKREGPDPRGERAALIFGLATYLLVIVSIPAILSLASA